MLKLNNDPTCPNCNAKLDGLSHLEDDTPKPNPSDFSVCVYCAELLVFNDDLSLRKLNDDDEFSEDVLLEVQKAMAVVRALIEHKHR